MPYQQSSILFLVERPISDEVRPRNGLLDEPHDLQIPRRRVAPYEPEKVQPPLEVFSRVAAMLPEEPLEQRMDVVYPVHRVGAIGHPFGLRGLVDLAFEPESIDEGRVAVVSVVDQRRSRLYVVPERRERPLLRWLRGPFADDVKRPAVGGGAYGQQVG